MAVDLRASSLVLGPQTPTLDPERFLRYGDPTQQMLLLCFALGIGAGEPQLAAIGRQIAEELAITLRAHQGFITLAQSLVALPDEPSPLLETSGGRPRVRPAFAVFHSLPQTQIVRGVCRQLGASLALTGRLVGDGPTLTLGLNLVDIERATLLACSQRAFSRDTLPEQISEATADLLGHFCMVGREGLVKDALQAVGTRSYKAFYNWSMVRDLERQALLDGSSGGHKSEPRIVERLLFALEEDPLYFNPLNALIERATQWQLQHNDARLRQMALGLGKVQQVRAGVGMLAAEAWRLLNEPDEARKVLKSLLDKHPATAQAHFLLGLIEEKARPQLAVQHFTEALKLDPTRALYREKVQQL